MKSGKTNSQTTNHNRRALLLLGTIATVLAAVACTSKPNASTSAEKPVGAMVRPVALGNQRDPGCQNRFDRGLREGLSVREASC